MISDISQASLWIFPHLTHKKTEAFFVLAPEQMALIYKTSIKHKGCNIDVKQALQPYYMLGSSAFDNTSFQIFQK
jgi:hypothetical protein